MATSLRGMAMGSLALPGARRPFGAPPSALGQAICQPAFGSRHDQRQLRCNAASRSDKNKKVTGGSPGTSDAAAAAPKTAVPSPTAEPPAATAVPKAENGAAADDLTGEPSSVADVAAILAAEAEDALASAPEAVGVALLDLPDRAEVKAQLLDSLFGTERGLSASSEVRAEISELISQLEALNPTPEPTEALDLLEGCWRLVYTSGSELLALLALGRLPLLTVGDITQSIDAAPGTVSNRVQLEGPFATTALSASAIFDVRSPRLLGIKFQEGGVATPKLTEGLELPDSVELLGQRVDLAPLRDVLRPAEGPLQEAVGAVSRLLEGQQDLSFPIAPQASPETWLLTTYLDNDTRITRGDMGSVFILVKEQP